MDLDDERDEDDGPIEGQQGGGPDIENFLRMLNQMRPEGEGGDDDEGGGMDEMLRRLLGRASANPEVEAQSALNQRLFQAVKEGNLSEAKKALDSGT